MTNEQRKRASVDLTLAYLQSYYSDWRLAKILTIKKVLSNRCDFYSDIIHDIKGDHDSVGEATIAQEIKHGLHFDAIAHCVQYVEDLFAFFRAAELPDYFVKNIITYDAGQVTNKIKGCRPDAKMVSNLYHFPHDLPFSDVASREGYDKGVLNLIELTKDCVKFYKDYEFIYNQYKHGLSVAMRPVGTTYVKEQIEEDKAGTFEACLAVYDNFGLETATKKGNFNTKHGVIMPGFSENVQPFISELSAENNYLRLVFPPDTPGLSIDVLVDNARKTRACIKTFIANYSRKIFPQGEVKQFYLPSDYEKNTTFICSYGPGLPVK
jgi:hypothetical protein